MKIALRLLLISLLVTKNAYAQNQCTDRAECWPKDSAMHTMLVLSEDEDNLERALAVKHDELVRVVAASSTGGLVVDSRLLAALKTQQNAWLKYRIDECELIGSLTGAGGTWPSTWALDCEVKHTRSRLMQVRSAISCIENMPALKRILEQNECLQQLAPLTNKQ